MAATATAQASPIYWLGQDGNAYLKGVGGDKAAVTKYTNPTNATDNGFSGLNNGIQGQSVQADKISDPNAPKVNGPPNPNNNSGNSTTPLYKDKSSDILVQNAGLASNETNTANGLAGVDAARAALGARYAAETTANENNYKNESDSNTNDLQIGKQTSLVRAAAGRQGLLGTLSSLGAISGDSLALANQAVQSGANQDLAGVNKNFSTNQSTLDSAIGQYRREDQNRNDSADTAAKNARINTTNTGLQARQAFLQSLVGDYTDQGDAAQAKTYAEQIAALYPQIAANTPSADLAYQGAAYTSPTLANYVGRGNTSVSLGPTPSDNSSGGPSLSAVNSSSDKKKTA